MINSRNLSIMDLYKNVINIYKNNDITELVKYGAQQLILELLSRNIYDEAIYKPQ